MTYKQLFRALAEDYLARGRGDELDELLQDVPSDDFSDADSLADELDDVPDYDEAPRWKRRRCEEGMRSGDIKRARYVRLHGLQPHEFRCGSCGHHMDEDASHIVWAGDPCDDCCCGACGSRKNYPGEAHC